MKQQRRSCFTYALLMASALAGNDAESFEPAAQPLNFIAPVALSSAALTTDAILFQAWFDSRRWNGDLTAFRIDSHTGQADERLWSAASEMLNTDWRERVIVTRRDDNGAAVPFRALGDLSPAQQSALGDQALLDYLRGDPDAEATRFKARSHTESDGRVVRNILGATIHANPVFDATADATRIIVAANDGMLHVFDAAQGKEEFAYVPGMIYQRLAALADADSTSHPVYSVDGGIAIASVRFSNGSTHRMLVGGLGAGGQGLYALDISAATIDSESAALGTVSWELGDSDDAALGYTYGTPVFVQLNDGRPALLVGNGYGSEAIDQHSGSGTAQLLVIDAEHGTVLRRLDTNSGSVADGNGLSTPCPVDSNADGRVDYAYAGDLHGHLWRFDLRGASSGWSVGFAGAPLYSAIDANGSRQAITTAPTVIADPDQGLRVLFGTGRLLSAADAGTASHSLYGVRDRLDASRPDSASVTIAALGEARYADGLRVRVLGAATGSTDADIWKIDLAAGEQVLADPLLDDGRLIATVAQAPGPSGEVWLVEVDALSGGAPRQIVFDMNADGRLDADDTLAAEGQPVTTEDQIVGRYYGSGIASAPVIADLSASRQLTFINRNALAQTGAPPCTDDCAGAVGDDAQTLPETESDTIASNEGAVSADTGALLIPPAPCGTQDCITEARRNPGRIAWKQLVAQ